MQNPTRSSASSQPERQPAESKTSIASRVFDPSEPLSDESRRELSALADLPDSEIDFSDIPETTAEDWKGAVRGPRLPLESRTVTLALDDEVYEWLEREGKTQAYAINFLLKREAQRRKRLANPDLNDCGKDETSSLSKAS